MLNTVTPPQVDFINEIFFNLLNIEHSINDRKYLKNKIKVVKKLADSKRSPKYRQSLVKKHRLFIVKILDHFSDHLKQLL